MNFHQRCIIPLSREALWPLLMDLERVGPCIPGVTSLRRQEDGSYQGALAVRVGPIALNLQGRLRVTLADRDQWRAALEAEAADGRVGGGLKATMAMELEAAGPQATALALETQARLLGRLGEFGQPVIRKKAQALLEEFARNLGRLGHPTES